MQAPSRILRNAARTPLLAQRQHSAVLSYGKPGTRFTSRDGHQEGWQRRRIAAVGISEVQTGDVTSLAEPTVQGKPVQAQKYSSLPDLFKRTAEQYGANTATKDPHRRVADLTYREVYASMQEVAAGFKSLGLQPGDLVSQFSENSSRWLLADQGVMMNCAANAVRGASASTEELEGIYMASGSCGLVLQDDALLTRLLPTLRALDSPPKFIVLLWGTPSAAALQAFPGTALTFDQVCEAGRALGTDVQLPPVSRDDLATLVFTSGTTGTPKAAALSHGNILFQVENFDFFIRPGSTDTALSLLPPWHIYERSVSYYIYSRASRQVYSSIPQFKKDLVKYQADFLVCVPLVLDTLNSRIAATLKALPSPKAGIATSLMQASRTHIRARRVLNGVAIEWALEKMPAMVYVKSLAAFLLTALPHKLAQLVVYKKIRAELGIQKALVSGGGSLPPNLDEFFEMVGVTVVNGWGMTETSPVLACRRSGYSEPNQNVRGTVGFPMPGTSFRVVDPKDMRTAVPAGEAGLVLVTGPGIMMGYWNNPEATESAFVDGYYNTGDLGYVVPPGNQMSGQLVLTGRAKDTIVLAGGENVEPQPLEDAICCSPIIQHAVVLGQDKRTLGCLVSLDAEGFASYLEERGDTRPVSEIEPEQLRNALLAEVNRMNKGRKGRSVWEVITQVQVVKQAFTEQPGALTRTMKIRREAIGELYSDEIASMTARLR